LLPLFFLARANPSAPSLPFSRRTPQATVLLSGARLLSSGWVSGAKALNCALAGKQPFGHALRAHQGTPLAQFRCNLTTFRINTYRMPASVDFKPLTRTLSPLDATLTKNQGRGGIAILHPLPTWGFQFRAASVCPPRHKNDKLKAKRPTNPIGGPSWPRMLCSR